MKTAIIFSIFSLAMGATIQQRAAYPLGFEACTETMYSGFCIHYQDLVEGQCYSVVDDFAGRDNITSVRVDAHNFCKMYPNDHCDPGNGNDEDELNCRGGYSNLDDPEIFWDGRLKSFLCLEGW